MPNHTQPTKIPKWDHKEAKHKCMLQVLKKSQVQSILTAATKVEKKNLQSNQELNQIDKNYRPHIKSSIFNTSF